MPNTPKYIWWNGRMMHWDEAQVHVTTLGWSTVGGVFEGVKAYWNADQGQLYGLRLGEHFARFLQSMRLQRMKLGWSADELVAATVELLRANGAREDTYVRPTAYFGETKWVPSPDDNNTDVFISTSPFQSILGTGKTSRACVSSWTRIGDNVLSPRVKCFSNYQNSRLALIEARQNGYDQPILLNDQAKVTEGAASCLFMIRDGVVVTPSATSGILESLTRRMVLRLCQEELGIPTEEREVDRTELYVAQEIFFCGTGAEISPVVEVDGYKLGEGGIGPITARIERLFHDTVRARRPSSALTPIYAEVGAVAP
jgi:branched-chain amino acid aminotransferase